VAIDPVDDDNPIEELLLTQFPNPNRDGCPSREVIEALGEKRIGRDDPAWEHVWHCSPCFKEFKAIRDKRLARAEGVPVKSVSFAGRVALAAAVLLCAILLGVFLVRRGPTMPNGLAVIAIDLSEAGTFRGSEGGDGRILAELPRQRDQIRLTHPRFSRPGRYIVAILKSKSETTAVALNSATASGTDSNRQVVLTLDLSNAEPGRYFLATRLEEQGQQEAAFYYPVLIRPKL
jgi:hypothetical protein